MPYACDNQECQYHLSIPNSMKHENYVRAAAMKPIAIASASGSRPPLAMEGPALVHRHLYVGRGTDFYLCDTCHKAVQMVVGGTGGPYGLGKHQG